jgi:hypothetical protein
MPFSSEDVEFFFINNIKEMRVCGIIKDTKTEYSLKMLKILSDQERYNLLSSYRVCLSEIAADLHRKVKENQITPQYINRNFKSIVFTYFCNKHSGVIQYEQSGL